jgi:hypothetical protein
MCGRVRLSSDYSEIKIKLMFDGGGIRLPRALRNQYRYRIVADMAGPL